MTPPEVRFRPAAPADADQLAALINERERLDRGVTEITAADVRAHWARADVEIAADGLIGELDGRIVCAALATRHREHVYVAADQEDRGLGSRLLEWVMARSVARGAVHHHQIVGAGNTSAAALLRGAGYRRARAFHRMRLALDGGSAEADRHRSGDRSADVAIRTVDLESDARALHRLDAAAFAANADYEPETFEQFRDEHLRADGVDRAATLAATDGDRIVGFLLGARRRGGEVGYVSVLGVDPDARRQGIATALLRAAFGIWRADGVGVAELTVASDNPRAVALYERLGMTAVYTVDAFERRATQS